MSRLWVGYIRVSDVAKRSGDSFRSPSDQRQAIESWVKMQGDDVVVLDPELNESGGRADRELLVQAVEGVERGTYCGIVAAYQSRFMRDSIEAQLLRARVEKAGGLLAVADRGIIKSDPESKMIFNVTAAFDQMELEKHSQRFKAQAASAVARGVYPMPIPPFGYSKDPETRCLVPNADAPKVVQAFNDRIAGKSPAQIALEIERSDGGVRKMLANRVYLGELRKGESLNRDAHPAIVTADLFDAVQALKGRRPARAKGHAPGLLIGLLRCQGCGHMMRRCMRNSYGGYVYECRRVHAEGKCQAAASITASRIEEFVATIARHELQSISLRSGERSDDTAAMRGALHDAEAELAAYVSAVSVSDVGAEAFRAGARERERVVREARAALEAKLSVRSIAPNLADGAKAWDALGVQDRNTVLRSLVEFAVVRRVGQGRTVDVADRVRIFKHGAIESPSVRRDLGHPVAAVEFPDVGDERVLWMPSVEDGLESASG